MRAQAAPSSRGSIYAASRGRTPLIAFSTRGAVCLGKTGTIIVQSLNLTLLLVLPWVLAVVVVVVMLLLRCRARIV